MTSTPLSVFVYGTLKPGGFYYKEYCEGRVIKSYEAIALGQLYDLPLGYPAMAAGNDPVWGYVLVFEDPDVLKDLDELEGYEPQRSPDENEYERVWVEVFDHHQQSLGFVWTYIMTAEKALALGGVLLPEGIWIHQSIL
ncbi:gamma-glutamylcyclotransferase [Oscillatoria sp. FACHB-1407]|uniref:gamma-glutamylcyclotransferase family protein n=1 Tax=Oscillatoria sp. FACHB-1407 TaxID=2692847 RepID=UPI001689E3F1|nr:gamma-glutamylcyclotransferase [Oscillatoria sp. FACHB-1407]MBD2460870.1 gamma-glutamylcyclotransferase [Oscillatoria sp. FACHB-1407]